MPSFSFTAIPSIKANNFVPSFLLISSSLSVRRPASGQITSFLDRFFYASKGFAYKPGAAIVSCRRGGSTAAFEQLNKYFTISNMPVVSSQYWNMVHGTTPDEVKQDLEGMQTMRTLGKNMAWLLKSIQAGIDAGIKLPEKEQRVGTNFIR